MAKVNLMQLYVGAGKRRGSETKKQSLRAVHHELEDAIGPESM
jgi:hypothetical protein